MTHTIEDDSGTVVLRPRHPHNGYYAGDFSAVPFERLDVRRLPSYPPLTPPRGVVLHLPARAA
jgi:hypothetical protein